jgi:hypothetical protein
LRHPDLFGFVSRCGLDVRLVDETMQQEGVRPETVARLDARVIDSEGGTMSDNKEKGPVRGGEARPTGRRPGAKPFIPFVRFEDVVARCGHSEPFGILPEGKDRFREDRRKKAMGRDCKACRQRRQQEEQEAAELRRVEKEKRKAEAEQPPQSGKAAAPHAGRLPDGSRFEVQYDAAQEQWSGSLTVPGPDGEPATFTGSGSALFPLLSSLDRQYRATVK